MIMSVMYMSILYSTAVHMISLYITAVYMTAVHMAAGHINAVCMTLLYVAVVAALYKKESSNIQERSEFVFHLYYYSVSYCSVLDCGFRYCSAPDGSLYCCNVLDYSVLHYT